MQTKEEIENRISLLKNEIADLEMMLEADIKIGDLVLVVAKPDWDSYVSVVRVDSIGSIGIRGETLHTDGFVNPASFSFENNTFVKISI